MKLKLYNAGGFHWIGFEMNGQVYFIRKVGRIGDCICV
jgi:hypothetical protein